MVDLTRRSFLGGLLAVTAATIVKAPKFSNYPVLHMNGVDDDAPALQAMLDGKPYIVESELIKGTKNINGGEYFIHSGLYVRNDHTTIENAKFVASPKLTGWLFRFDADYGTMSHCTLISNEKSGCLTFPNSTLEKTDYLFSAKGDNIRAGTPLNTDYKFIL